MNIGKRYLNKLKCRKCEARGDQCWQHYGQHASLIQNIEQFTTITKLKLIIYNQWKNYYTHNNQTNTVGQYYKIKHIKSS